jgi:hypothetical protein
MLSDHIGPGRPIQSLSAARSVPRVRPARSQFCGEKAHLLLVTTERNPGNPREMRAIEQSCALRMRWPRACKCSAARDIHHETHKTADGTTIKTQDGKTVFVGQTIREAATSSGAAVGSMPVDSMRGSNFIIGRLAPSGWYPMRLHGIIGKGECK